MQKIRTIILGASGYTGAELIRLLLAHPHVEIVGLSAERHAGQTVAEVFPYLAIYPLPDLKHINDLDLAAADMVFCALPHGTTQSVIAGLPKHLRIVDLSADFRLRNPKSYTQWYGHEHQALSLQKEAIYGLTEFHRDEIRAARLVANPGCYPTASALPLIPLLREKLIEPDGIIVDAKSGISGAGRMPKQNLMFAESSGGVSAYGVANHRHTPEIEQILSDASGRAVRVAFTPHLIPMSRGMMATTYVRLRPDKTAAQARMALHAAYDAEPFVHILPEGRLPDTHHVTASNHCHIAIMPSAIDGQMILISVIDNLVKGASGQAIQNMNLMYGFDETTAIEQAAVFP